MALANLFTLIDDIAAMTKITAQKTMSVVTDDIAVSAEKVSGFEDNREIPVILAVFKGALINKLILVPVAILLSVYANFLIQPLLLVGGLYLCYEGMEKISSSLSKKPAHETKAPADPALHEKLQVKGAIRTDFVLSTEIIVISLNIVQAESINMQIMVLSFVAILLTIGIYGLVAVIVKLDDLGFYLVKHSVRGFKTIGKMLLVAAPFILRAISIIGTLAMLFVGGNIIMHALHLDHYIALFTGINTENLNYMLNIFTAIIIGGICGTSLFLLHLLSKTIMNKI